MTDGSKHIVAFRPKTLEGMNLDEDFPNAKIKITTPDGRELGDFTVSESYTGEGEGCDLKYGLNTAKGDFKQYDIHFEKTNGVGLDLHYDALVEPFRQGNCCIYRPKSENL